MSGVLRDAALVCTALGVLSALAVLARTSDLRLGIGVLLEFLLAAGLLRLSADPTWTALLSAAVVVFLRRLLSAGLRRNPAMTKATR